MASIYDRITEFNKNRLPDIVKLKYKTMALNVFSFYRGTCHLFYEDLSKAPALPKSPLTWICGDLHLENFGSFKGDDRQEYFDLNDFDEALLAPALWEIVRMVTSILIAFESLALEKEDAKRTAQIFLERYSAVLKKGKALSVDPRTACGVVHEFLTAVKKRKQKELLNRFAVAKKRKFTKLVIDGRHLTLENSLKNELIAYLEGLIQTNDILRGGYKVLDCVFRLAGTGSLGVKRYLFLLKKPDAKNKYLFVDMKQALPSSLKPFTTQKQPEFKSDAARVIAIQQRMQNVSPALLQSVIFKNEPYVLKQMQPVADKINFAAMANNDGDIEKVIEDMAALAASAQLRSTGRQGSAIADDLMAYGEDSQWHADILAYAQQYAGQVKNDFKEFTTGYQKGIYPE